VSDSPTSSPQPPGNQYGGAIAEYRTNVKWVVSSFGAVAAALVVGIQLTSLGELHGYRLIWSVVSAAVVFASILAIIGFTARVLSPLGATYAGFKEGDEFGPLRNFLETDKNPLRGQAETAEELAEKYDQAVTIEKEKWVADDGEAGEALGSEYAAAKANRENLFPVIIDVTDFGIFLRTKQLFQQAMLAVYIGVAFAAAGTIAFAYLANPPAPPKKSTVDCVAFYVSLDQLLDDEPGLAKSLPRMSLEPEAKACGIKTAAQQESLLSTLAAR
jgi:hypothetical protein